MSTTIDLTRELRPLYTASSRPKLVEVPELAFVMIDGHGDPATSPAYVEALEALYGVSYALRFALKQRPDGPVFKVMPLEGLWWADDMRAFAVEDRDAWRWTMMIAQPGVVTAVDVDESVAAVRRKRGSAALDGLRFECLAEGRAAQVLHVGPYDQEGPTIERLHGFIAAQGLTMAGRHHEIYLGDPRRAAPERLRTILRQPVA